MREEFKVYRTIIISTVYLTTRCKQEHMPHLFDIADKHRLRDWSSGSEHVIRYE